MPRFVGDMNWRTFILGYVSFLVIAVTVAIWGGNHFHVDAQRIITFEGALLFLIAAVGRPNVVYRVVRNTGWFAAIESDTTMRGVLVALAVLLGAVGVFGK